VVGKLVNTSRSSDSTDLAANSAAPFVAVARKRWRRQKLIRSGLTVLLAVATVFQFFVGPGALNLPTKFWPGFAISSMFVACGLTFLNCRCPRCQGFLGFFSGCDIRGVVPNFCSNCGTCLRISE